MKNNKNLIESVVETNSQWTNVYRKIDMPYPSEYVIRIFKGTYARLNLRGGGYSGKSILDVSCGVGRNFPLFSQLGFEKMAGTEINEDLVEMIRKNCKSLGIQADIKIGDNISLNFESEAFDYLLAWNVCYYMSNNQKNFDKHIKEYARVLKPGGYLIFSIPCQDAFIYDSAEKWDDGYLKIKKDWFGIRNDTIHRYFKSEKEIEDTFSPFFKDFVLGSINDDCFGLAYKWHIGCCIRR